MAKPQKIVQTSLPNWQLKDLQNLGQQGQLSGVQPQVLAGIETAEYNPAYPPSVNSSDFGGYFGLGGPSSAAPSGMSDAALKTPATYSQQAIIAAQDFAAAQQATGGTSNYAAEQKYQGGGSQGVGVFRKLGIPDNPGGSYPALTGVPSSTTPSQQAVLTSGLTINIPSAAGNAVQSAVSNPLPGGWADPLNWPANVAGWLLGQSVSDTLRIMIPMSLVGIGLILIAYGLVKLWGGDEHITLSQAPPPGGGGKSQSGGPIEPRTGPSPDQRAARDAAKVGETAGAAAVVAA